MNLFDEMPTREQELRAFLVEAGCAPVNERQQRWAELWTDHNGPCFQLGVKAARHCEYDDPELAATNNYHYMGSALVRFMEKSNSRIQKLWNKGFELLEAQTTKSFAHQGVVMDEVTYADNGTQTKVWQHLTKLAGMEPAVNVNQHNVHEGGETPIGIAGTLSPELQAKIDDMYATAVEQDKGDEHVR